MPQSQSAASREVAAWEVPAEAEAGGTVPTSEAAVAATSLEVAAWEVPAEAEAGGMGPTSEAAVAVAAVLLPRKVRLGGMGCCGGGGGGNGADGEAPCSLGTYMGSQYPGGISCPHSRRTATVRM